MRSSCETVETNSDFISSTARSSEMSRNAKIRPLTAPAGSVITVSDIDSQTSSAPRRIASRRPGEPPARRRVSARPSACSGLRTERLGRRDARDALGGGVPEHDGALAVDGDDPVGDVGQDRLALPLLDRDALVELRVGERRGGVSGEREQRVDLLPAPLPRPGRQRGEHAVDVALGPEQRHADVRAVAARGEQRIGVGVDARPPARR